LQLELVRDPQKGVLIQHSGGFYKLRWSAKGQGKSGGVRIIYYWMADDHQIYMLLIYSKSKQDDLMPAQVK